MDNELHIPLADLINVDVELLGRFDKVFERCGKCLVGNYDREVEHALFDLLLVVEPGLYTKTSDGLGSSLSTTFSVIVPDNCKPACHELRRMSKAKNDFVDNELKKM
jgi:hypothetical protein